LFSERIARISVLEMKVKHSILGTAGHVDHGKTALIKALTGTDTDRLKEEKERGITIELGFASLTLSNGKRLGVVDVPGHERFVKNMVAGAGGIDMVLLVIAADEGIMPQTREHMDICTLLGVNRGLVAVTKVDLVDKDWLSLIQEDIRDFIGGTFLGGAPVIPVSVVSNTGLAELIAAIEDVSSKIEAPQDIGLFRLPIDRIFTMKGFGTVVTGTLLSGRVKIGENVEIYPGSAIAKVRGIQVHNETVETAEAGQRTAINLQGLEKEAIERGNMLGHPSIFDPGTRFDVSFELLSSAPKRLKNRALVRFHTGTSEVIARIILLDRDELAPGDGSYAQLLLESPGVTVAKDRFVVRSYSPVRTIGGGVILDPIPRKHKRHHSDILAEMKVLEIGNETERTSLIMRRADLKGVTIPILSIRTGINQTRIGKILQEMLSKQEAVLWDREAQRLVSSVAYRKLQENAISETRRYHHRSPLKSGIPKEELRMTLGDFIDVKLFNLALRDLEKSGRLAAEREMVRIPDHRVNLQGDLEQLREQINKIYLEAGPAPPTGKELREKLADRSREANQVLTVMLNEGILIKVDEDLCFHRNVIRQLRDDYRNQILKEGKSTPATFKELTGLSRKFIIPLMEYFDVTKLTIRVGDHRVLRDRDENMNSTKGK
jgi:selenocysteine-specific elongation factor